MMILAQASSAAMTGRHASANSSETSRPAFLHNAETSLADTSVALEVQGAINASADHLTTVLDTYNETSRRGTDMMPFHIIFLSKCDFDVVFFSIRM
jgi:hypothetical protein